MTKKGEPNRQPSGGRRFSTKRDLPFFYPKRRARHQYAVLLASLAVACLVSLESCSWGTPSLSQILVSCDAKMSRPAKTRDTVIGVTDGTKTIFIKNDAVVSRAEADDYTFPLASLTKQFTGLAILYLLERHHISESSAVGDFFPSLNSNVARLTIRSLLSQSSDLPDYVPLVISGRLKSRRQIIRWINNARPSLEGPHTHFMYSNTNYFLLGVLVTRMSGRQYWQFLEGTFFKPLRLNNIGKLEQVPLVDRSAFSNLFKSSIAFSAGGLESNIGNLLSWEDDLRNSHVPGIRWKSFTRRFNSSSYYGGFYHLIVGSANVYFHNGSIPGFHADAAVSRSLGLSLVALSVNPSTEMDRSFLWCFSKLVRYNGRGDAHGRKMSMEGPPNP